MFKLYLDRRIFVMFYFISVLERVGGILDMGNTTALVCALIFIVSSPLVLDLID